MSGFWEMRPPMHKEGLENLIDWINEKESTFNMKMIEIGSYIGESTIQFARRFSEVVSVDPFLDMYDENDGACYAQPFDIVYEKFLENTLPYKNIKNIRLKSEEAYIPLKKIEWDFVYIDGIHKYENVLQDIKNYKPLIKKGGFIGGHDYNNEWPGVKRAVNESLVVEQVFKDFSWICRV